MNNFWDERYRTKKFAYGEAPNTFIKQELAKLKPGKILFPAEGEGRNAVFAATIDWDVTAFDPSIEAKKKAELLEAKHNTKIDYQIASYENVNFPTAFFNCIVLVFAHMSPSKRNEYHKKLSTFLKPGGQLILEGFSKEQVNRNTGGPKNSEMLFSKEEMENDFSEYSELKIEETETLLNEGPFHQGVASVIRVVGIK